MAVATHGGAAATSSLSPQTFLSAPSGKVRRHRLEAIGGDLGVLQRAIFAGRWALGAFGIGAPNRRNDRLGACTSVERCGTEKSDDDPHDEIAHLEAHIEELADKIESCRKFCSGTCSKGATRVGRWERARAAYARSWQPSGNRAAPHRHSSEINASHKKNPGNVSGAEFFLPSTADARQGRMPLRGRRRRQNNLIRASVLSRSREKNPASSRARPKSDTAPPSQHQPAGKAWPPCAVTKPAAPGGACRIAPLPAPFAARGRVRFCYCRPKICFFRHAWLWPQRLGYTR